MLFMATILLLTGVVALAAIAADLPEGSIGRHIGTAIIITAIAQYGVSWLIQPAPAGEYPWFYLELLSGAAAWLISWPWARYVYDADNRQATLMASIIAGGLVLLDLFWRWAIS